MTRPADSWKAWYAALRAAEPDAYTKAIQYAEGTILNHPNLFDTQSLAGGRFAAAIEFSHVMLACELLGVRPTATQAEGEKP